MRRAFGACAALVLSVLGAVASARAETFIAITTIWPIDAEVASALDDANTAFSAAWVAGDVEALMAAYTSDAVVHPPAGGVLTTPEHIRTVWAPIVSQSRLGHTLRPTLRQDLSGGEVLEMGRWHSARSDGAGGVTHASGCYTVIWRNDDGRWRMRYDSWTAPNDNDWACRPRVSETPPE